MQVEDRTSAATQGPARRLGAHRRVVRVRSQPARGACTCWRRLDEARPLAWCHRYDGGRSVYTAMGHTRESFSERRLPRATCSARSRWPPAARGSTVRLERRSRVRASRSRSRRAAASDAEPPAPTPGAERPRSPPPETPGTDGDPTWTPPPAPATARARRSTRSRSIPATARSWSASGPALLPPRPGREGGRAHRSARSSTPEGNGTVSGQPRACASPAPATCSPPATRRRATLPENLGADPLERPRRDVARSWQGTAEADYHELEVAGEQHHRRQRRVAGHPGVSRDGGTTWRDAHAARAPIDVVVDPADPQQWAVSTEQGTFVSTNGGQSWRPRDTTFGARLAWPRRTRSTASTATARSASARTAASSWEDRGDVGGLPSEVASGRKDELLVGDRRREDPTVHGRRAKLGAPPPLCADATPMVASPTN